MSGIAYRAFAEGLEDNPGLSPRQWLQVADENRLAQEGEFGLGSKLGIFPDQDARRDNSIEQRFGAMADAMLVRESIVTDEASRWKLIEALAKDMTEAVKKLARNADGDYSADTYVGRFPAPAKVSTDVRGGHLSTPLLHTQRG
ncbi:MAG: hypothetical protein JWP84_3400 [Tardiphaga sp.]|nr:hypothetical protein [Tardiphaga sp.]